MRLSTKGRYAVTAMLDLALRDEEHGHTTLADISGCQDISLSYLEQLFARLRKGGLVQGLRGPGGGYRLARDGAEISIAEIITAVDENVQLTRCGGRENCKDGERCLTHDLWMELSESIHDYLSRVSLADLVERGRTRAASDTQRDVSLSRAAGRSRAG